MGRFIFIGGVRFFGDNDIRVGKHEILVVKSNMADDA